MGRALRGDFATVVVQALKKGPAKRYASAAALVLVASTAVARPIFQSAGPLLGRH